eukprot:TRINITY_DN21_c0_g2_i12.p2 TRINITY_DN21_c0_g2~~TRINITY_DN21_c0_g2_i12.p2  ORF type:complete len:168 (-),score=37.98 TRINITY_DN21_c0_g2_i12:16-519(-)
MLELGVFTVTLELGVFVTVVVVLLLGVFVTVMFVLGVFVTGSGIITVLFVLGGFFAVVFRLNVCVFTMFVAVFFVGLAVFLFVFPVVAAVMVVVVVVATVVSFRRYVTATMHVLDTRGSCRLCLRLALLWGRRARFLGFVVVRAGALPLLVAVVRVCTLAFDPRTLR